jgi:hypothetical protein
MFGYHFAKHDDVLDDLAPMLEMEMMPLQVLISPNTKIHNN